MSAGVEFTGEEAAFVECAGEVDLSTVEHAVERFGEGVGVTEESAGGCDWLLRPGGGVVICPLLFNTPGARLASGDDMRLRRQRSGFFGRAGFSGDFVGLPGLETRFKS